MKEDKVITNIEDTQAKKVYTKPVISKVQLVAEEAVLALCKTGIGVKAECEPTPSCHPQTAAS